MLYTTDGFGVETISLNKHQGQTVPFCKFGSRSNVDVLPRLPSKATAFWTTPLLTLSVLA